MPATSGGSNAGADGNGHAYSLAYGWDQYSFGANYFGLAFDQMGQVHIVNFRPSMIWSDTHFDTNQLVYTKTLGDTSGVTKSVPAAYSNYLKASVFKNDSAISYVKEKISAFNELFDIELSIGGRYRSRTPKMLTCCPTDDQAEVLVFLIFHYDILEELL